MSDFQNRVGEVSYTKMALKPRLLNMWVVKKF